MNPKRASRDTTALYSCQFYPRKILLLAVLVTLRPAGATPWAGGDWETHSHHFTRNRLTGQVTRPLSWPSYFLQFLTVRMCGDALGVPRGAVVRSFLATTRPAPAPPVLLLREVSLCRKRSLWCTPLKCTWNTAENLINLLILVLVLSTCKLCDGWYCPPDNTTHPQITQTSRNRMVVLPESCLIFVCYEVFSWSNVFLWCFCHKLDLKQTLNDNNEFNVEKKKRRKLNLSASYFEVVSWFLIPSPNVALLSTQKLLPRHQ